MWKWMILAVAAAVASSASAGEGIEAVLARSQAARLNAAVLADPASPGSQAVRASFERLALALGLAGRVELRVVRGEPVAEAISGGGVVLANESLARLGEGGRLFILAHEIGHLELRHWEQMERVYKKWVPNEVTPEATDAVARRLGQEASELAYRQEFEADAFALRALHALGLGAREAQDAFNLPLGERDMPTHPSSGKRIAALFAQEEREREEGDGLSAQSTR